MGRLTTKRIVVDAILLVALVAVSVKLTHGVRTWMDLALVDESGYLQLGVSIPQDGLPHASWGVLYSMWYFMLDLFAPDRVSLQFLSFRALVVLMAVVPYLALRRLGALPVLAAVVPFLFLISRSPFPEPRPMHLAVVVLFLFALVAGATQRRMLSLAVLTLGLLCASLARVELFLGFLAMASILAVVATRRFVRGEKRRECLWITIGVVLVSVVVLAVFGSPVGAGRSGEAFEQHFALNYVRWTGAALNPWTDTDIIIEEVFGDIDGLGAALASNPAAFGRHVAANIQFYSRRSVELILPLPRDLPWVLAQVVRWSVVSCFALPLLLAPVFFRRRRAVVGRWGRDRGFVLFAIYAGVVVVVVASSALIVYPRDHYLVGQGLFVAALFALGVSRGIDLAGRSGRLFRSPVWAVGLGVVALFLTPNRAALITDEVRANPYHQPNLKTVESMRALGFSGEVVILHDVGIMECYLDGDVTDVHQYSKPRDQGFEAFRKEYGINVILLRETLVTETRFRDDPEWLAFVEHPESHGFRRISIANTRRYLLVAEQLSSSFVTPPRSDGPSRPPDSDR